MADLTGVWRTGHRHGRPVAMDAAMMHERIGEYDMEKENPDNIKKKNKKSMKKRKAGKSRRLSEYVASQLSEGAVVDFIFYEDFDGDGQKEAVIGVTRFAPFPPDSAVLIVKAGENGGFGHEWFVLQETPYGCEQAGVIDNAAAADTDGDGRKEAVISRVFGHRHEIDITVIDWDGTAPYQAWHSGRVFFHGSVEVADSDDDGVAEIIVEFGTQDGHEVISPEEACYHVRKSMVFKWDGKCYRAHARSVDMPYASFNTAVDFLKAIWLRDYEKAYSMVMIPPFSGLCGLDDPSLPAFKEYINKKVMPALSRNIEKGKLVPAEPYDTCCHFSGPEDDFTIELSKIGGSVKISGLMISKKRA
jgi:hypothetical protein